MAEKIVPNPTVGEGLFASRLSKVLIPGLLLGGSSFDTPAPTTPDWRRRKIQERKSELAVKKPTPEKEAPLIAKEFPVLQGLFREMPSQTSLDWSKFPQILRESQTKVVKETPVVEKPPVVVEKRRYLPQPVLPSNLLSERQRREAAYLAGLSAEARARRQGYINPPTPYGGPWQPGTTPIWNPNGGPIQPGAVHIWNPNNPLGGGVQIRTPFGGPQPGAVSPRPPTFGGR